MTTPAADNLAPIRHTVDTLNSNALDAIYNSLEAAEAALARIRALHHPTGVVAAAEHGNPPDCAVCGDNCWPCPTYNAATEPEPTTTQATEPH